MILAVSSRKGRADGGKKGHKVEIVEIRVSMIKKKGGVYLLQSFFTFSFHPGFHLAAPHHPHPKLRNSTEASNLLGDK